jgi:hypothetical protein
MRLGSGKLLALIAVIIFILAAVDAWPDDIEDDIAAIPLGLAFLAASFVLD